MDENFREEQDRQFDSEGQTQEQTQTASEQTTEQMNMQNENSSYRQTYGSSNVYGQTGAEQNANAYNRQNAQSSMYHGTPGQNMYFGGAFYSSNQHAGYNSQTGYTSAYTNPSGNAAQGTGASTQNMNGYSENVNKAMQKAAEKEKKKSEKMVRSAKKKADKKAKKDKKGKKERPENIELPNNYYKAIIEARKKYDVVLTSMHWHLLDFFEQNNIEYYLAYPTLDSEKVLEKRCYDRGNNKAFTDKLKINLYSWNEIIKKYYPKELLRIQKNEYLEDVLRNKGII